MAHILIVYATKQQQTEKIANFISDQLCRPGNQVDIYNVDIISDAIDPSEYDAIVAGAPIHLHRFPRKFRKWIQDHVPALNRKPTAFFTVCLAAVQKEKNVQKDLEEIVKNFLRSSHWTPRLQIIFAGALTYSKYNWFTKRMMKRIAAQAGTVTEFSQDYEYTDWNKVSEFSESLNAMVQQQRSITSDLSIRPEEMSSPEL